MTPLLVARISWADPTVEPVVAQLPCASAPDPFTWGWAPAVVPAGGTGELVLWLDIPDGGLVYAASVSISPIRTGGLGVQNPTLPEGFLRRDAQGAVLDGRRVFDDTVNISVPVRAPAHIDGPVAMTLALTHEGCLGGRCWPRRTDLLDVFVDVVTVVDAP